MKPIACFPFALTVLVVACGGGGSSGGSTTAPTSNPSTIVASVPAANYAAGSQEKAAYDYLNAERAKCGFGLLAQNAKLDTAAAAHANYIVANNAYGHGETVGATGFTGTTPAARATAAGYSAWWVGEGVSYMPTGLSSIKALLGAPYHLNGVIYGAQDVGVGYKIDTRIGFFNTLVVNPGVALSVGKPQTPSAGTVLTYPCSVSSIVDKSFTESINWATGVGTGYGGTPVGIYTPNGEALSITSASYTAVGGGIVPVSILTEANDPNKLLYKNIVNLIPPTSLVANTTYRVQVAGTAAGVAFTKDFNFTTGN
jgi:uncharacterized protein YkwD